jgi:O-antigen/teichoic acid export membrane protein
VVAGLVVFAPFAIEILYGDNYVGAGPVLRALAPSLLFIFPNYALTHFLIALQGQKWNAVFAGACLAVNAIGNVFAIAKWGPVGAALTTVLTEATLFLLCWVAVRRRMSREFEDGT